mgnify:CR=1 FL=1|tara:strand:+ start:3825 stop:4367 length:543 start_codon:yes stop_codon:yes gene_type:complete
MKEKLEYKILKYLSNNENGEFLDISHLSENNKLLKDKISDFKKREFLKTRLYPPNVSTSGGLVVSASIKPPKCLITSQGNEYLLKIEKDFNIGKVENKTINYNLKDSNVGQINQDSESSNNDSKIEINTYDTKKPIKKTIAARIFSLITENKLISGLIIGLIFEESIFGKITELIKNLIE